MAAKKKKTCYLRRNPYSGTQTRVCRKITKPRKTAKVKQLHACVRRTVKELKDQGQNHLTLGRPLVAEASRSCAYARSFEGPTVPRSAFEPAPPWVPPDWTADPGLSGYGARNWEDGPYGRRVGHERALPEWSPGLDMSDYADWD